MSRIYWSLFCITLLLCPQPSLGSTNSPSTATLTLDQALYFLAADSSNVLVQPGTYQLEVAEEWLRLVPGERRDALLLEAHHMQHAEVLRAPKAVIQEGKEDEHRLVLLLPDGRGLEAIGSVSGIRSRAVRRPLTSRTKTQQRQASRISIQPKKGTVIKKSKRIHKSPAQPNNPLTQRVQTLEQQVGTLLTTINSLQSRLNRIESAVQVSNSGKVTINGTTMRVNASLVDVRAGMAKFSGVVQSDTVVTKSVVSESYTPGAGNIW